MEGKRDVEMGISGKGMEVGGEKERTKETGKKMRIRRT